MGMMEFITSYFTSIFTKKSPKEPAKKELLKQKTIKADDLERTREEDNKENTNAQIQNTIVLEDTNYEILFDETVILNNFIQQQIKQPQKQYVTRNETDKFKRVKKSLLKDDESPHTHQSEYKPSQQEVKHIRYEEAVKHENKSLTSKIANKKHANIKNKVTTLKFQEEFEKKETQKENDNAYKKWLKSSTLLTPKSSKNNKQKRLKKSKKDVGNIKKKRIPLTIKRKKANKKVEFSSDKDSSSEISKSLSYIDICLTETKDLNEQNIPEKNVFTDEKTILNQDAISSLEKVDISSSNLDTHNDTSHYETSCNPPISAFKEDINNTIETKQLEIKEVLSDEENITKYTAEELELPSEIDYETKKAEINSLLSKLELPIENSDLKIEEVDFNDITEIPQENIKRVENKSEDYIIPKSMSKQRNKMDLYETAINSTNKSKKFQISKTIIPDITRDENPTPIGDFIIPDWAIDKSQYTKEQNIKELVAYFKDEIEDIWEVFPTYEHLDSPTKISKKIIKK